MKKFSYLLLTILMISILSTCMVGCLWEDEEDKLQGDLLPSTGDMTDSSVDSNVDISGIDRRLRNKISFKDAKVLPSSLNELRTKYDNNNYNTSISNNILTAINKSDNNISITIKYIENGNKNKILKGLYDNKKSFLDQIESINNEISMETNDEIKIELLKKRNIYQRIFDYTIITNQGNYYIYGHIDAYNIFIK